MRSKRGCKGWWLAPLAFALDRLSKAAVRPTELVPGLLRCRPVRNTGMAFSLLADHPWLLAVVTAFVLAGVTFYLLMKPDEPTLARIGLWLVVGGGLGNLFDRLAYGYVIDFLELEFVRFAIFNVADVCVCVGAGLALIGYALTEVVKHGKV